MPLVRILRNQTWPNLMQQTPGSLGVWGDFEFTLDTVEACDYVLILNKPAEDTIVRCPPERVWAIIQEPPNEMFGLLHRGDPSYARIYTSDPGLHGDPFVQSQPALPWLVKRDFDYLSNCSVPDKGNGLSWITSDKMVFKGHRDRMRFLERIQGRIDFDLFGKGYQPLDDKWDGLAPYRYSLAIENFSNPLYWSEKIADCFLAWTMPIYYGCTRITEYFPAEAMVQIDIHDEHVLEKIQDVTQSDLWKRGLEAIAHAREMVLKKYQLFPFIGHEIQKFEGEIASDSASAQEIYISHEPSPDLTAYYRVQKIWRGVVPGSIRQQLAKIRMMFE